MDWKSLGSKVAQMGAEILGEAIPFPGADDALSALADQLGTEKKPGAMSDALDEHPEATAKLREIELKYKTELERIRKEHKQEMRGYQAQDAQGARDFAAKEMKSEDQFVRRTRPMVVRMSMWLVVAFVALFVLILGAVLLVPCKIPETNADLGARGLSYLAGVVFMTFATAFRSYTTRRSMDKMTEAGQVPESLTDKIGKVFSRKKDG